MPSAQILKPVAFRANGLFPSMFEANLSGLPSSLLLCLPLLQICPARGLRGIHLKPM